MRNYYYLILPIKSKYQTTHNIIIHNTQPTNNPNPNTMTKMFHSKPLLDMGLQKSLDLGKNVFWYIIQPPNYFSNYFLYNLNILPQTAQERRIQTFSSYPIPKYAPENSPSIKRFNRLKLPWWSSCFNPAWNIIFFILWIHPYVRLPNFPWFHNP